MNLSYFTVVMFVGAFSSKVKKGGGGGVQIGGRVVAC